MNPLCPFVNGPCLKKECLAWTVRDRPGEFASGKEGFCLLIPNRTEDEAEL